MKKSFWALIILGVVIIGAGLYLINQQHIAKFYIMPTTANEPGLKLHMKYFASSLTTPEKLDFVVFQLKHEIFGDGHWVFRLMAKAGDTIQIKDGVTFVNGTNIDASLKLKHSYTVDEKEFQMIQNLGLDSDSYAVAKNQYIVNLPDAFAQSKDLSSHMKNNGEMDDMVSKIYGTAWNEDHFGPYIIPEESIFVLGDNRHNAMDSRFIGVIPASQIVGVIKNR